MGLPTSDDLDVSNRRVLVRVDFNVPLDSGGAITDDTRIRAALPTIRSLLEREARLILCSHLGRPKVQSDGSIAAGSSLEPVAARLAELLEREVKLPDEVVGDGATKVVNDARAGEIVMLENLRCHAGEKKNDPEFARALAKLCDAYVNDAFGVSHRAHASVVGVPALVRDHAAGQLVAREVEALQKIVDGGESPLVAVVGGAKVADKLGVLVALTERLRSGDSIVIGGAMANTFLLARGSELGGSRVEKDMLRECRRVEAKAEAREVNLLLPTDLRVGGSLEDETATVRRTTVALTDDELALDIGPESEQRFSAAISGAGTVFWNGPMGVFENPAFAQGTLSIARAMAECDGYTVVGGGDSVAAVNSMELSDRIDHVSTGGGASLEFVEGRILPGLAALEAS
jgi:phosphoglycerate kinase